MARRVGGHGLRRVAGCVALAGVVLASVARAGASKGGVSLQVVGQTGGAVRAVVAVGATAWVGEGIGLTRLDLSNPDIARFEGHFPLEPASDVWALAWEGRFLYVGGTHGVHAVDVQNPTLPRVVDHLATTGTVRGITAFVPPGSQTTWLFVVDPTSGVTLVETDEAGRLRPRTVVLGTLGTMVPVAVDGRRAVVGGDGLHILDVARPDAPVEVARLDTSGQVRGLAVRGDLAFVSDSIDGLVVLSLAEPAQRLGTLAGVGAGRLYLRGDHLYILEQQAMGPNTVRLVDVSKPASPSDVLGGESTYAVLRGTVDLALIDDLIVGARGTTVAVADVISPFWPQVRAEYESAWPLVHLANTGGCVYAAKGSTGLDVIDVSDPPNVGVILSWRPPAGTYGVLVYDGYAYLSTAEGLARFDVHSPCDPIPRGVPLPGWPATRWIAAGGSRVMITTPQEMAYAALVPDSDPVELMRAPYRLVPGWPSGALAQGLALYGSGAAYVAAGQSGVVVLSLLVPSSISVVRVERAPEGLGVSSVAVRGHLLAVGTTAGLLLYDLHDPFAPRFVGAALSNDALLQVAFGGDTVYAAGDLSGLLVFDVSDPTRPSPIGAFQPGYPITAVAASDRHVYVVGAGVQVLEPGPGGTPPTATSGTATGLPAVPTATPRPTRDASPTATWSPTPTPTPTPTASPTDVATVTPRPPVAWLFLPLAHQCRAD